MRWFGKRRTDTGSVDVPSAIEKATRAKSRLLLSEDYANTISKFFEERKGQNGFGEDFEFTLNPRTEGNQ